MSASARQGGHNQQARIAGCVSWRAGLDSLDKNAEVVVLDGVSASVHHRRLVLADCNASTSDA